MYREDVQTNTGRSPLVVSAHLLWRETSQDPIETYGAEYGDLRHCLPIWPHGLRQVGLDNTANHLAISASILCDFYVDFLTGADTVEETIVIKGNLQALLQAAGLNLLPKMGFQRALSYQECHG